MLHNSSGAPIGRDWAGGYGIAAAKARFGDMLAGLRTGAHPQAMLCFLEAGD